MKKPVAFNKFLVRIFSIIVITILFADKSKAQSVVLSPSADPSTYVVGATIAASATVTKPTNGSSVSVVYTIGSVTVTDNSSPYTDNISTSTLAPGTYTLTATYNSKKSSGAAATPVTDQITVNILPVAPTGIPGNTCGTGSVTLSASGGSPAGGTYIWYSAATGGSTLQTSTSPNYTRTLTANTTFYVSYKSGTESARTAVAATVGTAPTSTFTATATVAAGSAATITYTGADPTSSTFTWDFDGAVVNSGSGKGPYSVTWSIPGTHNVTLTVINTAGCTSSTTTVAVTVTTVALGNYGFEKPIILNTSQITNGGISTTLTNFPALVYIQDDALKTGNNCGDKVQFPTGKGGGLAAGTNYDFAFTTPGSSTELNYQVDTYDAINGILLVWVRIPSLTSTNVPLTFYFGSPTPAHTTTFSAATWASDYLAVYHFNEASTSATVLDATSNGRNAYQTNTSVTNDEIHIAAGVPIAGGGYSFNGASTSIIQNAGSNPDITGSFTLSAWVYYNGLPTSDNKIVSNELKYNSGYKLSVKTGSLQTETRIVNGNSFGDLGSGGTVTGGSWHYIQGVFTGGNTTGVFVNYVDGVAASSMTNSYPDNRNPAAGHELQMGIDYLDNTLSPTNPLRATNYYYGYMDEVRVSNAVKSADWIRCEYYNQTQPKDFTDYAETTVSFKANASALTGALVYTWTGADATAPTDQTKTNNWDQNDVPVFNGNTKMNIPVTSTGKYPVLTADASIYSLTIASGGAYLNLNGHTLNVGCNIYNNATTGGTGILNAGNMASGVNWNGSLAAQGYYGANVKNTAEISDMTVNNTSGGTITLTGGPVDIFDQLTLTKGNLTVDNTGSGALTLKSSATQNANVAFIPATYSITGNVNVERYISGGSSLYRGYRLLSSPVYTAKSGTTYFYDLSYLSLYTPITGTLGAGGGMSKQGNPTIYLYRDNVAFTNATFNTGNFRGVNKINNSSLYSIGIDYDGTFNLHPGTGFMFFYRGDLSNIAFKYTPGTSAEASVFSSTGVLNQQSVTVTNWYTQSTTLQVSTVTGNTGYSGYNLVGNPYPSAIDWTKFSATDNTAGIYGPGVGKTIYIFNIATKNYATFDGTLGVNGGSKVIPSGQGFFIKAAVTVAVPTPQLTFTENAKTSAQLTGPTTATGATDLLLSTKPITTDVLQYMRLELAADTINKDEAIIRFNSAASDKYVLNEDSEYFTGSGTISLASFSADSVALAINNVPLPKLNQKTVRLRVNASSDGTYSINRTELQSVPQLYDIWLMDGYKKDSLDLRANSAYRFDVLRSDTNSYGANRFTVVIRQNAALGLHLLDFAGAKATTGAQLTWKTENEQNYTNFTIERSTDNGATFTVIGGQLSNAQGIYTLLDRNPLVAADQYRLKMEDLNGTITYSKVITLMYGTLSGAQAVNVVDIYPNPATSTINVSIVQNNIDATKTLNPTYILKVTSSAGKVLKTVTVTQATWTDNVSSLLPGTYIIDVTNKTDNTLIGKGKFIKL